MIVLHEGARIVGGALDAGRDRAVRRSTARPGQVADASASRSRPRRCRRRAEVEYGSILVPVFGEELDDDIVGTAGRLAAEQAEEGEGGAVIEALYVFEIPMSLPLDARVPDERVERGASGRWRARRRWARSTRAWRWRRRWCAAARSARRSSRRRAGAGWRRSCWPPRSPTRIRGGRACWAAAGGPRDRFVGETTRYVIEKAPCRVILTAPPADGTRKASPSGDRPRRLARRLALM